MSAHESSLAGTPRAVFGAMLRFYRRQAQLSQEALGAKAHISGKTISAYENGWRVPTRAATADIDAVPQMATNGALTELWDRLKDGMSYQAYPSWFQDWAGKEAQASTLRWFEPLVVPGLLQTQDYARAIFRTRFGAGGEEIEEQVAARVRRQEVLARANPVALWVILDEWVLRRPIGGVAVMAEQMSRLIEAAREPAIAIEVIPASVGAHEGLTGAFALADFAEAPTIGYREAAGRGIPVEDHDEVSSLELAWATLRGESLPRRDSLAALEEAAKAWTSAA